MRLVLALILGGVLLPACQSRTVKELPTVRTSALEPVPEDAGPWKPEKRFEEIGGPWRVVDGNFDSLGSTQAASEGAVDPFAAEPPPLRVEPAVIAPPPTRKMAIPRRRARREARPVGQKTTRSPEELAREHFLDYPTRVKARKLTLYVPPAFAREVRLSGDSVSPPGPRRQARGGALLTLRELTLEAERLTLRVRDDGRHDLQIMARGDVSFISDVRANVLREEGLKSLLITNDQVVPIR